MKFISISSIINIWGLVASHATATDDSDSTALVADGPVADNSFPKQARDIIRSVGSSDALRGSDGAGAETGQDFLDEDLEVSCVAKYCSKLYKLQKCESEIDCDEESPDSFWVDVSDDESIYCKDDNGDTWYRNYDPGYQEVLPLVTCKTSWGSAPNGQRDMKTCWYGVTDEYVFKLRWVEISGSLKNKSANKCENRCDYQGSKVYSLSLWGCCGSYSDSELGC